MAMLKPVSLSGLVLLFAAPVVLGQQAVSNKPGFFEAVQSGKAAIAARYRYEWVDQDSLAEQAHASVLRLRLNYRTGEWNAVSAFAEFDHVVEVVADDFNSGAGTSSADRNRYPVVADPNGSDLNQLYLDYKPLANTQIRLGRQRILHDKQRFIGGVGWRQNEQTYDALTLTMNSGQPASLNYSYVANVNRIFGDSVAAGDHNHDTHLLNGSLQISDETSLGAYAYLIDNEDAPAASSNTIGVRLQHKWATMSFNAEFARQEEGSNAPRDYSANYMSASVDWKLSNQWALGAGFESLGGDESQPGAAFRTPLATLHAFNGWADQFLATPDRGLEDVFIKAVWSNGAWQTKLIWHDFSAEAGSESFGNELDFVTSYAINKQYSVALKAAHFDGKEPLKADVSKLWLVLSAQF